MSAHRLSPHPLLFMLTMLLGSEDLVAETGAFGLVSERHFYPIYTDADRHAILAIDLFLGGYKPALALETSYFTPNGGPLDKNKIYLAMCHELAHQLGIPRDWITYRKSNYFTADDPQNLMLGITDSNGPHLNHFEWAMIQGAE